MTSVVWGNLNPGTVSSEYCSALVAFLAHDSQHRQVLQKYLPWKSSGCLDLYRNMVVEQFLDNTECEWLWFVDSDIEVEPDTLYKLLDSADPATHPVVSAVYPMLLNEGQRPSIFYRGFNPKFQKVTMNPYDSIPEQELISVDGTGAGCLLIHRSLLQAMRTIYPPEKPWFDMGIFDGVPYGEDFTFCMRVSQMGYPISVNTTALVHHHKSVKLSLSIPSIPNPTSEKV